MVITYTHGRSGLRAGFRTWLSWWPVWAPLGAALWSLLYAVLGAWWTMGGPGFPLGVGPRSGPAASLFAGVSARAASPIVTGLTVIGVIVALMMMRSRWSTLMRRALLVYAWFMAVILLVLVPDARAIVAVAYAPIVLIGAPFGWPPADFRDAIPWSVLNQYVCVIGGLLWVATAIAFRRAVRGACVTCGRTAGTVGWTSPASARQWGKWATAVAVVAPLPYAFTRIAWSLGVPIGIDARVLRAAADTGHLMTAAALGAVALGGALLTLGLTRKWGEVFPRWVPLLRHRRVPPALAIVPATFIAILVFSTGLSVLREGIRDALHGRTWIAIDVIGIIWPLWGISLGAATLAYYYRRRGACPRCG